MDERVRYKVRREGSDIFVDLMFDECQLSSRLIVGGDEKIALMVESGELRLTKDSKLVFEDGTPYPITQRKIPRTTASGYVPVEK